MQEFGGPEVLATAEVPDPAAGPGEAVVAVAAAHVLWVETRIRTGVGREYWGVTPPYVPGSGVAGRVESVGQDVDPALLGARVVAHTGRSRDGYAERVVVGADGLVPIPDSVSFAQAAPAPARPRSSGRPAPRPARQLRTISATSVSASSRSTRRCIRGRSTRPAAAARRAGR